MGAGPRVRLPTRAPSDVDRAVGPVRTCVGCRRRDQRSVLVRVVAIREGDRLVAVPDLRVSRPGRGAWLHRDLTCLGLAERRRALTRALRVDAVDTERVRAEFEAERA